MGAALPSLGVPTGRVYYDAALEGHTRVNEEILKRRNLPPIYESGVGYRRTDSKQWRFADETFETGGGDCEALSTWRAAELRLSGEDPDAAAVTYRTGKKKFHAVVLRGDERIEDPSLIVGMPVKDPTGYVNRIVDNFGDQAVSGVDGDDEDELSQQTPPGEDDLDDQGQQIDDFFHMDPYQGDQGGGGGGGSYDGGGGGGGGSSDQGGSSPSSPTGRQRPPGQDPSGQGQGQGGGRVPFGAFTSPADGGSSDQGGSSPSSGGPVKTPTGHKGGATATATSSGGKKPTSSATSSGGKKPTSSATSSGGKKPTKPFFAPPPAKTTGKKKPAGKAARGGKVHGIVSGPQVWISGPDDELAANPDEIGPDDSNDTRVAPDDRDMSVDVRPTGDGNYVSVVSVPTTDGRTINVQSSTSSTAKSAAGKAYNIAKLIGGDSKVQALLPPQVKATIAIATSDTAKKVWHSLF